MTETSTTPTPPPLSCPPWCTTDHASDINADRVGTIHGAHAGREVFDGGGLPVNVGVFLHSGGAFEDAQITVVHSGTGTGSGVTLLSPRTAPAIAKLLRALGHDDTADALDRAVATLGGAS